METYFWVLGERGGDVISGSPEEEDVLEAVGDVVSDSDPSVGSGSPGRVLAAVVEFVEVVCVVLPVV